MDAIEFFPEAFDPTVETAVKASYDGTPILWGVSPITLLPCAIIKHEAFYYALLDIQWYTQEMIDSEKGLESLISGDEIMIGSEEELESLITRLPGGGALLEVTATL